MVYSLVNFNSTTALRKGLSIFLRNNLTFYKLLVVVNQLMALMTIIQLLGLEENWLRDVIYLLSSLYSRIIESEAAELVLKIYCSWIYWAIFPLTGAADVKKHCASSRYIKFAYGLKRQTSFPNPMIVRKKRWFLFLN